MDFIKRPGLWAPALVLIFCIAIMPSASNADTTHDVRELKQKVAVMEQQQSEIYHTLEEKKAAGLMKEIAEKVSLGGLIELEASREVNDSGGSSDIVLATVELALDAEINEQISGHLLFLFEEDDTPFGVDEGTVTYKAPLGLSVTGGKMYIPFGVFNSHFISDPFVLELGETNETAVMVNYVEGPVEVSFGSFNGTMDDGGDDDIQDYFGNITVSPIENISFGAYYTSNIGDSDGLEGLVSGPPVRETIPAYGGFLSVAFGRVALEAEIIKTKRDFEIVDLDKDGNGKGDRPSAFNIELAYQVNDEIEAAIKYEESDDLFDLPLNQYGVAFSYGLFENVSASFEYLRGEFADETKRTLYTGQLAIEF